MKKLVATLLVVLFVALGVAACKSPCEKALGKWKDCMKKKGAPAKLIEKLDQQNEAFMKECKKKEGKVKKCLEESDCDKFDRCMERAL